jgi:hypothetical protein
MSDEKDVAVQNNKKVVEAEDNVKLDEISRGYRVLLFNNDHFLARLFKINSIRIYDKSVMSISRYGDELYTRTRNRLMKDPDVLTYDEQLRYLSQRGLWSDDHEERLGNLRLRVAEINEDKDTLMSKISASSSKNTSKKAKDALDKSVKVYTDLFQEYSDLLTINLTYFKDTLEVQSDIMQLKGWIVSTVVKNEGGDEYNPENRLWRDVDHLNSHMKENDFIALKDECISFWSFGNDGGESFFAGSLEELTLDSDGEEQKS